MKIRIAVAIDADGRWRANGDDMHSEDDLITMVTDDLGSSEYRLYIVEADVEPYSVDTVNGKAKKVGKVIE